MRSAKRGLSGNEIKQLCRDPTALEDRRIFSSTDISRSRNFPKTAKTQRLLAIMSDGVLSLAAVCIDSH